MSQQYTLIVVSDYAPRSSSITNYLKSCRLQEVKSIHEMSFYLANYMMSRGTLSTKGRRFFVVDMQNSFAGIETLLNQMDEKDVVFFLTEDNQINETLTTMGFLCAGDYQPKAYLVSGGENINDLLINKISLHMNRRRVRMALDELKKSRRNRNHRLNDALYAIKDNWRHLDPKTKELVSKQFIVDETSDPIKVSLLSR